MSNQSTLSLSVPLLCFINFAISIIKCNLGANGYYEIKLSSINHQPLTKICIGTPLQCINCKIATNVDNTFINIHSLHNQGFQSSLSSTFLPTDKENTVHYGLVALTGKESYDVMEIPDQGIKDPNFKFVLVEDFNHPNYNGVIGLGPKYRPSSYSLIHSLYFNHYITQQQFLISYNQQWPEGKLLIGDIPKDKDLKYKRCYRLVYSEGIYYECKVSSVIYYIDKYVNDTIVYSNSHNVIFSPTTDTFLCPKQFFDFLLSSIFYELINKRVCSVENDSQGYETIICNHDVYYQSFGKLIFIIGKWNMQFTVEHLFLHQINEKFRFLLMHQREIDKWLFGYNAFQHYEVLFDLDRDIIHFKPNRIIVS